MHFAEKTELVALKSDVVKSGIDKLKNVPSNLSNLKSTWDKLDVDKLVPVPADLNKLSFIETNDIVKKDVYNAKIINIENEIPDITNLAKNATVNAKINEVKNEIPSVTNLATTIDLTPAEDKIPDHSKCITTPEFNKLTTENFTARLAETNLASKNDIANFVNKAHFH